MTIEAKRMKSIVEAINSLEDGRPFFSFEFFPPKTEAGTHNLTARIERLSKLGPLFIAVTWGAGGSTAAKSLQIAQVAAQELGLTTLLHLTCTNMDMSIIDDALDEASRLGIRNILALRGDPPRGAEYNWSNSPFKHAADLVRYIRKRHGNEFCIGVAAYPEGHVDGNDKTNQSPEHDMKYLAEKIEAGGDFIVTQLFYDTELWMKFEKLVLDYPGDVFKNVPVIPGLMPVNTYQSFIRSAKLSNATIPKKVMDDLKKLPLDDDDQVKDYGVDLLTDIVSQLREKSKIIKGFHFYTLNLEKSVAKILTKSHLVSSESLEAFGNEDDDAATSVALRPTRSAQALASSEKSLAALSISTGKGELGREATWDDFPNGRFGNSKSPAFGEIDGYGPTLHLDNAQALKSWGYPVDTSDITKLFVKHITNELDILPWSDQRLSAETALIQEELMEMNEKGLWTVASQPSTGGCVKSTDKIFGWGPKGGQLFQKAFVEFFISNEDWLAVKQKIDKLSDDVSYYAGDARGNFESNLPANSSSAVTWGVFPDREILQSTIIEEDSFRAWRDEAFSIWKEWQMLYPRGSASAQLLERIHDTYKLVNIVHHDFFNERALWTMILE